MIHDWENLTYSVTVRNQVSNESRMTTTLSSPFTFSESIGKRDCQLYEFTLVSMNQVGLSTNGVFGSRIVPTGKLCNYIIIAIMKADASVEA